MTTNQFVVPTIDGAVGAFSTQNITAYAGGGQTNAVLLTTGVNLVATVATAADSVKLPAVIPGGGAPQWLGANVVVINNTANPLAVYPSTGDTINGLAANASITQPPYSIDTYVAAQSTTSTGSGGWFVETGVGFNGSLFTESSSNALAAAGTTQSTATPITTQTTRIATSTVGSAIGVALPLAAPGLELAIINDTANTVTLFGANGGSDTINDTAGSTGIPLMANSMVVAAASGTGKWYATGIGTGFSPTGVNIETTSYTDAITAGGTNAATATALTTSINRVTTNTGTGGVGVTLPVAKPGLTVVVSNATANTLTIYGNGSDDVQQGGSAAAASITVTTLKTANLFCASTGHWHGVVA